jgi:uncharacterized protein involved in exopolysaccharide biosynthesis
MEKEVDLLPYLRALRRRWLLVIATGAVFAIVAFVLTSFVMTPYYRAEALVRLAPPAVQINLDSRIYVNPITGTMFQSLSRLALNDDIVQQVLDELADDLNAVAPYTVGHFQQNVLSTQSLDGSILRLSARWPDPTEAVRLVEAWARVVSSEANALLGFSDPVRVANLEAQRDALQTRHQSAQESLVAYRSETSSALLEANQEVLRQSYVDGLARIARINQLLLEADTLRAILSVEPDADSVRSSDLLALVLFQAKAFGDLTTQDELTLHIDAPVGDNENVTYADLLAQIDAYKSGLQQQQTVIEGELAELGEKTQAAERDLQIARLEITRLQSEFDRTYAALQDVTTAISSLRLSDEALGDVARVVALPVIPQEPSEPRVTRSTLIAGVMGLVFGLVAVFLTTHYRTPET